MITYDEWVANRTLYCACAYCSGSNKTIVVIGNDPMIADIQTGRPISVTECQNKPVVLPFKSVSWAGLANSGRTICSNPVTPPEARGPCRCKRCNTINEYAEPNQGDGGYICFSCR